MALYALFVVNAIHLSRDVLASGATEVMGWDYGTFVSQFGDWSWIGYFGFRHPGLGIVCSPIVILQHVWSGAYLLVMPAIATVTAWLIWKLSGWVGLVVWLLMPTVWMMAAIPESFPIAQLALVASLWLGRREIKRGRLWVWGVMAVVNGMITLTNGLKPALAYVATCGNRKKIVRILLWGGALVLLGVGLFYARSLMTGRSFTSGISKTLNWIPTERNVLSEAYGFFIVPLGVQLSYVVYPLALWGVIRAIRQRDVEVLMLGAFFAVDVSIHFVIGWGMGEPWVFAPHWIWILPILIGRLVRETRPCIK